MTTQAFEAGAPVRPAKRRMRFRPPTYRPGMPLPLGLSIPDFKVAADAEIGPLGTDRTYEKLVKDGVLPTVKIPGTKGRLIRAREGLEILRKRFEEAAFASQGDQQRPASDPHAT
jgi:hypothetical protein